MFRRASRYIWSTIALALMIVFSPAAAGVIAQGVGDGLLDNVPEPANAVYRSQNAIQGSELT